MRYLIILKEGQPFYTEWFNYENFFDPEKIAYVFDLATFHHTTDGKNWLETENDTL